jgi:hypothetical protein
MSLHKKTYGFHLIFSVIISLLIAAPAFYYAAGLGFPQLAIPVIEPRKYYQKPDRKVNANSLTGKATLLYRNVKKKTDAYDRFFRINFPFRNNLIGVYQFYKENLVFADPYPQKVFKGTGDWLFIGNSFDNTVFESSGITQLNCKKLYSLREKIYGYYEWCKQNNIHFYFMPVPEKQTVYNVFYPISRSGHLSVYNQLMTALKDKENYLINIRDTLNHTSDTTLYSMTDTHWTGYGAYRAYCKMLNTIQKDFPEATLLKRNEVTFDTAFNSQGDLAKMLFRPHTDTLIFLNPANKNSTKQKRRITTPKTRNQNFIEVYEQRHITKSNKLKVMIYRDSFFVQLAPCTNESFGETILLWDFRPDTTSIKTEQPDIVILECAERILDEL